MIGSARAIYINITCKNFNDVQCDMITEDKLLTQGKLWTVWKVKQDKALLNLPGFRMMSSSVSFFVPLHI